MAKQEQFLDVVDRDTAMARFRAAINERPLGEEQVALSDALHRVLARDVVARVDVPSFDRSNLDGYAVRAEDTYGAREEDPRLLRLADEIITTAMQPAVEIRDGEAATIATGGMLPRGADAIVMIEDTDLTDDGRVIVRRAVTPGRGLTFAGADIARGETILRRGDMLSSRETGVLAAIGEPLVYVQRKPRVAILSTGDEIIEPGEEMRPGLVFDSNARILADAVREAGGLPVMGGVIRDDEDALRAALHKSLTDCDVVLMSGGTSKGEGDLSYRVVAELKSPGIVAHGVALKPGKPICLASEGGKPVVILPGFPTSAIFTFHEFAAPVIRRLAAASKNSRSRVAAKMATQVRSEIGRTEFLLVGLAEQEDQEVLSAYPMGKGSGSVTTFSKADGFAVIDRHRELVEAGDRIVVQLFDHELALADLHVVGSHCVGLDYLLGEMQQLGFRCKSMTVGSTAGLEAAERNECDLAGIHLLDPESGVYNRPLLSDAVTLIPGYGRMQGVVYRADDSRFDGASTDEIRERVLQDAGILMVSRNRGSGTRALIDQWLGGVAVNGYANQARSHNAVAAAVSQHRADWGLAIEIVATQAGLGFAPLAEERFDFAAPNSRMQRPALRAFSELLQREDVRRRLTELSFRV